MDVPTVYVQDGLQVFSPEARERAEARLAEIERSTGFVGVFVTEPTTESVLGIETPRGPEVDGHVQLRYSGDAGCCATVYGPREPGPTTCSPFVDRLLPLFAAGRADEGLRVRDPRRGTRWRPRTAPATPPGRSIPRAIERPKSCRQRAH